MKASTRPNEYYLTKFFIKKSSVVPDVKYKEIFILAKYAAELHNYINFELHKKATPNRKIERIKLEAELTRVERYIATFRKKRLRQLAA